MGGPLASDNFNALIRAGALKSEVSTQYNQRDLSHRSRQQMWIICYDFWQKNWQVWLRLRI